MLFVSGALNHLQLFLQWEELYKRICEQGLLVSRCKTAAVFLHFLFTPLNLEALTCGAVGAPLEQSWNEGEGEESQLEGGAELQSLVENQ